MDFISYYFNLVFYTLNTINIPFPVSPTKIFYLNGFTMVFSVVIFAIVGFFIGKLLDLDVRSVIGFLHEKEHDGIDYVSSKVKNPNFKILHYENNNKKVSNNDKIRSKYYKDSNGVYKPINRK